MHSGAAKNVWQFGRFGTDTITIGNLELGQQHPVRVQSMANTPTHNVEASVNQAIQIFDAGGELVRFTVITQKDAEALNDIKQALLAKGYNQPLVADVHFNPDLADIAAKYVDKVRINPGNYLDKRATFNSVDFTDAEYRAELERLAERFGKFIDLCQQHHTAIRVGTNHGSLSDRIMSRYGDTPAGMVEATMEFLRICKSKQFNNVLVSLKSSNTRVMVQAYRLLALQMQTEGMNFGLHLGVTEAGNAEDGRIKSAVGIGCLMGEGLGDTIRVSLTEHPANEIPVARKLVAHFTALQNAPAVKTNAELAYSLFEYRPRKTNNVANIGGTHLPVVVADLADQPSITEELLESLHFKRDASGIWQRSLLSPDVVYVGEQPFDFRLGADCTVLADARQGFLPQNAVPLFSLAEYLTAPNKSSTCNWVQMDLNMLTPVVLDLLRHDATVVPVIMSYHRNPVLEQKAFINLLMANGIENPTVVLFQYMEPDAETFQLKSAADTGVFFIDGLANGLWLKNSFKTQVSQLTDTAFGILQAARSRVTKTEYISCPGCGRTLFELEKTLEEVKKATTHLTGLKIAVMGCIVNGPGEMADADYGYVGTGPGKVSLYKGKEVIKRNIDTKDAVAELLNVINASIKA